MKGCGHQTVSSSWGTDIDFLYVYMFYIALIQVSAFLDFQEGIECLVICTWKIKILKVFWSSEAENFGPVENAVK